MKKLLSKLEYPYNEMLESLKDVRGYNEYLKDFISYRIRKNDHWKAEVSALFELNKERHPLIEICSQKVSEPEGIFKADNGLGIIEAAKIGYLFDTTYEKRTIINRIQNYFKPIGKLFKGQYSEHHLRIEIDEIDGKISDVELEKTKEAAIQLLREGRIPPQSIMTSFGRIIVQKGKAVDVTSQDIDLLIGITEGGGTVTQAYNVDLNKKIRQVLKAKRFQHKSKYDDFIRLYYFLVDCPPPRLVGLDLIGIVKGLDYREMVYLCTQFGISRNSEAPTRMKSGIVLPGSGINQNYFDFSNRYFSTSPLGVFKSGKRIL